MNAPRVTVIIPTFNHPGTVAWAVRSVQEQTVTDIRIVVIGDGVTDATRAALAPILAADDRVEFLDRPKTKRHGEEYRDEVIRATGSPVIAYCGDDDLLHPDHLESMLEDLTGCDFTNPLPVFINPDDSLMVIPTDLSRADVLHWHVDARVMNNAVSLHGVSHTRESYLRLPEGWRTTPPGWPTDLHMWQKFFKDPAFRGRTSTRSTTAKFYATARGELSPEERGAELERYYERMHRPGFTAEWAAAVNKAIWDNSVNRLLDTTHHHILLEDAAIRAAATRVELASLKAEAAELDRMRRTFSWRITAPLRAIRSRLR